MTDLKYVQLKINSNLFNLTALALATGISRATIMRIKNGTKVRSYLVATLAIFFKNVGL